MEYWQMVRQQREKLGLTQTQLAGQSGVSLPSIQKIEAGRANPSLKTLEKLGQILQISVDFRVKEIPKMEPEISPSEELKKDDWTNDLAGLAQGTARQRANSLFRLLEKITDPNEKK